MATQQELRKLSDCERQLILTERNIDPRGGGTIKTDANLMTRRPYPDSPNVAECPTGVPNTTAWAS